MELPDTSDEKSQDKHGALNFLRDLTSIIQGARYQKHVLPLALVVCEDEPTRKVSLSRFATTNYLSAGALDVVTSPLGADDINRIIGHFKDVILPPARLVGAPMAQNLVDSIHDASVPPGIAFHRPDEILSAEKRTEVETAVRRWNFPAQDFNMDELTYAALHMLESLLARPELKTYSISRPQLMTFLLATRRQYKHEREVQYHNWRHAVDVTQSLFCFLLDVRLCPPIDSDEREQRQLNALEQLLTPVDALIILISAIGHDVGHPGVNNAFLVACSHPLAQTYNDKSVLENYHCAAYSQLLRRHWSSLGEIPGFRTALISTILATDMQRHFEYMSSLGDLKSKSEKAGFKTDEWSDKEKEQTRELLMALLMKAADISNVARPFDVSSRWAKILMKEFARQGELESELQIPTCLFGGPPNTEDVLAAAQSQKGFMSLFGMPLFQGIAEVMPSVSCAVRELEKNRDTWDKKIEEEKRHRQPKESGGQDEHFGAVHAKDVDEAHVQKDRSIEATHRQSEPAAVPAQPAQAPSTPTKRAPVAAAETSSSKHAAHAMRQQMSWGIAAGVDRRSTAPLLDPSGLPVSPARASSRRSSKDIALDHLQSLAATTHQNSAPGSRRGSADASWQIHQSYPSSRRGSKDESLTTILVTSGSGSPAKRHSPPSLSKTSSPAKPTTKRHSAQSPTSAPRQSTSTTSTSPLSSRSPPAPRNLPPPDDSSPPNIPSTEDPFSNPTPASYIHRSSAPPAPNVGTLPTIPPTPPALEPTPSTDSCASGDPPLSPVRSEGGDGSESMQTQQGMRRQSRSRSRLRGLKFWKKRREGFDVGVGEASASP